MCSAIATAERTPVSDNIVYLFRTTISFLNEPIDPTKAKLIFPLPSFVLFRFFSNISGEQITAFINPGQNECYHFCIRFLLRRKDET